MAGHPFHRFWVWFDKWGHDAKDNDDITLWFKDLDIDEKRRIYQRFKDEQVAM